ncbi:MAG: hypothetical protein HYU31_17645 [Deltaproteobacteria bacterium]|nr:hypothetical protein [Deltaproteobacteria bacterium]
MEGKMKLHGLTPVVSLISSAESAEAFTLLRSSSYGGSVRRIHSRAYAQGLLRRRITVSRRHLVSVIAGAALLFPALSHAQGPASGSAPAGESQITLRKSVQSREYQGKAVEGEERTVVRGDSLWRILIQEKGLPEKRFQSYLVVIRGLNPQVKDLNVLRVGNAIFIPLRPDEVIGARSATSGSAPVPQPLSLAGTTVNYRVKAGEHLYQILRQQLGLRDQKETLRYYALTKDLNPEKKDWNILLEGETIRLPVVVPVQEAAGRGGSAAPESKPLAETAPPAAAAQTAPTLPALAAPAGPALAAPQPSAPQAPAPMIDTDYARRLPAADGMALLAGVVENLGAQLQRTGEEVVAVKDSAVRFDRSSYPVVYSPKIRQRVVIDTGGNIPESLRNQLNNPEVGAPVVSLNSRTSLHDAVNQLLAGLGYQTLSTDRPVVIQEAGVAYEAKGNWMALAPEESNKPQEIFVINLTDQEAAIPPYLLAQLEARGLQMRDVVVSSSRSTSGAVSANEPKEFFAQTKTWPRDKKEMVDSLLLAYGIPFGVAEKISVKLSDGLTLEARADRVFEARGNKVALFFQRTEPELKKALQEKRGLRIVETDIAALSSREVIGRLLSELGEQVNYREHRFPAGSGPTRDRLVVTAWGFLVPKHSMFVTDREIPQSLHRFFFDKGLEIVYFQ